jgi:Lrp/AsnC family transcriptional regulator, leucine-responsive regulatory protein
MRVDFIDKEILNQLMLDCRQTNKSIGKKIRSSREVIAYRINRLEKHGFIKKYLTLINSRIFGFETYNIYIHLQDYTEKRKEQIIDFLVKNKFTKWVVTCSGRWDIIATILVKDSSHIDKLTTEIFTFIGQNLRDSSVTQMLKLYNDADLLFIKPKNKEQPKKINTSEIKYDIIDMEILDSMNINARINVVEIAKKINLTPEAIAHRIKKLRKNGIIRKTRSYIDMQKFDYTHYMLVIDINITEMIEKKINAFCNISKNISFADKGIGQLRIEIMSKNHEDFHKSLDEIRNTFPEIKSYELLVILEDFKQQSFPLGISEMIKEKIKD